MSELVAAMPFAERLGLRVESATKDQVRGELAWAEELCTAGGVLHGGALIAAADSVGALCAFLNLPEDATGTTTIESKTNLLAAVREGTVAATATPLHVGGSVIVVETEVRAGERLVAKTTQTQMVLLRRPDR
jgi:1,4-dihydroxy-2-naphthoyl-CoA hydrolase